ncbi:MAG: RNase adapter RapZ [Actinomycetota bacterium]
MTDPTGAPGVPGAPGPTGASPTSEAATTSEGSGAADRRRILVITGMSGAGRSTVSNVVEDLGWFVIDNLPPTLIAPVTDLAFAPGSSVSKLALVADARGREFFGQLLEAIRDLRATDADVLVIYLEADDEALVRRFEETRRRHPAAGTPGSQRASRASASSCASSAAPPTSSSTRAAATSTSSASASSERSRRRPMVRTGCASMSCRSGSSAGRRARPT